jgi:hypothetical protein
MVEQFYFEDRGLIYNILKNKIDTFVLEKAYKIFNEEEFKHDIDHFISNISKDIRKVSPEMFCKRFKRLVVERKDDFTKKVLQEEKILDFKNPVEKSDFFNVLNMETLMSKIERNLLKKYLITETEKGEISLQKFDTFREIADGSNCGLTRTIFIPQQKNEKTRVFYTLRS